MGNPQVAMGFNTKMIFAWLGNTNIIYIYTVTYIYMLNDRDSPYP